jgi:O-antigen/teichoic acid export membrane protein
MLGVLIALGVSILAGDILRVMTPATYWGAAYIVPLIALSYVLIGLQYVVSSGIYIECKTVYLGPMGAFTALANLALNYLLISRYLAMGAAIATVLSFAVQLLLTLVAAQRVYRVQYEYVRNAILLGAATAIYFVSLRIEPGRASSAAAHLLLFFFFVAVSFAVLDRQERQMLRRWGLAAAQELHGVWARARHRPVSPLPAEHIHARITGPDGAREGGT